MTLFTIGHSTRSLDEFVALLQAHGVSQLGDVRTVPKSRRHPHFAGDALAVSLPTVGIAYRHLPALGGLRKPRRDSTNSAWRHEGFRGYADYMESAAFGDAVDDLIAWARASHTAVMCAEAVVALPSTTHRRRLVARGVTVQHIQTATSAPAHKLTEFAQVAGDRVSYPGLV